MEDTDVSVVLDGAEGSEPGLPATDVFPYFIPHVMTCYKPEPLVTEAAEMYAPPEAMDDTNIVEEIANDMTAQGFVLHQTKKKKKKQVQHVRTSAQFPEEKYDRTHYHRFLMCLPPSEHVSNYEEGASQAMRSLKYILETADKMLKAKTSGYNPILILPWCEGAQKDGSRPQPLTAYVFTAKQWGDVQNVYLHKPGNVRYAQSVWFRIYIGFHCKDTSSNNKMQRFATNLMEYYKVKNGTDIKVSADVLQTEFTKDIGYFLGSFPDTHFDSPAFSASVTKATGIATTVHMANVGFISSTGEIILNSKDKEKAQFGKKATIEYKPIRALFVEVATTTVFEAAEKITKLFNTSRPEHVYPMQMRYWFVETDTANPNTHFAHLALAKAHMERNEMTQFSEDCQFMKDVTKPLVRGKPITLQRILMDISAYAPDRTGKAFLMDQVNTNAQGHVRFVYNQSQSKRVKDVTPFLYQLIKTHQDLILHALHLDEAQLTEFNDSLDERFTPEYIAANRKVTYDPETGTFNANSDKRVLLALQGLGQKCDFTIACGGDSSVRSAMSGFTDGGLSTTSMATKMRLALITSQNELLEEELAEQKEQAALLKEQTARESEQHRQRDILRDNFIAQQAEKMEILQAQFAAILGRANNSPSEEPTGFEEEAPSQGLDEAPNQGDQTEGTPQECMDPSSPEFEAALLVFRSTDNCEEPSSPGLEAANLAIYRSNLNDTELNERFKAVAYSESSFRSSRTHSRAFEKHTTKGRSCSRTRSRGKQAPQQILRHRSVSRTRDPSLDKSNEWQDDIRILDQALETENPGMLLDESAISNADSEQDQRCVSRISEVANEVDLTLDSLEDTQAPMIAILGADDTLALAAGPQSNGCTGPAEDN